MKLNLVNILWFLAFNLLPCAACLGQWSSDFNSDNLEDWAGDVDYFIVNENNQLQLNAPAAGQAYIYRSSTIDFDTVSFGFFHSLDFAPSDNNKSRIYLALDQEDLMQARGYFIEIGENGSEDALKFYYLDGGSESFIASASMGAMANEPATVRVSINIYPDGFWSVNTNYDGDEFTSLELEFVDQQFSLKESQFFGLNCTYSASRTDKFFYDDIVLQKFEKDIEPPSVIEVMAAGNNTLMVNFSEPVIEAEATVVENYSLNNGIGNPLFVTPLGVLGNQYLLEFAQNFDASKAYFLTVSGISDFNENVLEEQVVEFLFAGQPEPGDLWLSEILFDPYPNGEDFVEIYNSSNKFLELMGLSIRNDRKDESRTISGSLILPANSYLALTPEVDFLFQEYKPEPGANIENQELPSFNNDSGNVMLVSLSGIVLDSFDYSESLHFPLLDDTEGVSLERVSFEVESGNERNWQSAAKNVRYATPGYKNSNSIPMLSGVDKFVILNESFSPNQDGEDDQMILSYNLEKSGYVANIIVYDASGFRIKELSNNELLSSQGIVTWDGTGEDNKILDLGIYVVVGNVFHPDGDSINFKKTTVLADFID